MKNKTIGLVTALSLSLAACSALAPNNVSDGKVSIKFDLRNGAEQVRCGKNLAGLGVQNTPTQITDARFYVSNVVLINSQNQEVPVKLAADNKWQDDSVALLDFEDGSGNCKDGGTPDTNFEIKGTVPNGNYTGVKFTLGVPFEKNHQDVTKASAPLNIPALWWSWQGGYKHLHVDLKNNKPAPNNAVHSPR